MNRTSFAIPAADRRPDIRDLFLARRQRRLNLLANLGTLLIGVIAITLALFIPLPF